jgi:hypothetical protein
MIQELLLAQLDRVAARQRWLRLFQVLSLVWLVAAVLGGALWAWRLQTAAPMTGLASLLIVVVVALAMLVTWYVLTRPRNYVGIAVQIEQTFPELHTALLAAIEQRPDPAIGEFGYLQTSVMREALQHAYRHQWAEIISRRRLLLEGLVNIILLVVFAVAVAGAIFTAATHAPQVSQFPTVALPPGQKFTMSVEPGNTEVERGASLLVLARIQGQMPAEATLVYTNAAGEEVAIPMPPSLADPLFGGRIPVVDDTLEYYVRAEDQTSPKYRVTVFEYPKLERADAKLVYPQYTGMEERLIQDVRTVSAVEGTKLTIICLLNKPVASAQFVNSRTGATEEPIILSPSSANPLQYEATVELKQSRRLKLELIDDAGRKNQKQEQFTINVLPNQPPAVKPLFPARDLEVSALEELDVKSSVSDDFGLVRFGLSYALAGKPPVDVVLLEKGAAKQKHEIAHQIRFEDLQAEPDQLLSYYWWAEDHDPAGNIRRTQTDMYFAEVRPFEEIYRQGEQPLGGEQQQRQQQQNQQGQGQNAQQAQELARLQKDIINATWKIIRREITPELTKTFAEDVEQIRLSQAAARDQASSLAERVEDEKSLEHVEEVLNQMQEAIDRLQEAEQVPAREPLSTALAAEQAAYQALLKLRAREHEVVRQQMQQQQQGQQSQSQQQSARSQQQREQLNQLDLRDEENRYETQRTAQELQQESVEERENRQVLNRLRELAQRQHDLNERLKELQAALEAAETPQEKEELRKQLKRLQDEERQILQDTDELQARLDQPENQERMAEQQRQLDETRDQVRRASEALQEERIGQATAAGTRAEQQFDELREEFRRRAANRFSEEVQELRQAARELEERQQSIAEQLKEEPMRPSRPSLQDEETNREPLTQELANQRERLANLQERMRDTIERAESTEPILSERLYEAARNLRDQRIERALEATERSVRQGLNQDAQRQEAAASEGLRQLREGIERAAEGVLGDETEALRRARAELEQLTRELNREVQRNASRPGESEDGDERNQQARNGNQPGQQPRSGEEPDERSPGQGQRTQQEANRGQRPGQQEQEGQQPGQGQQRQPMGQRPGEQDQPMEPGERRGEQEGQPPQGQQSGQGRQPGQGQQPGQRQQPRDGEQPMNGEQPENGQQRQEGQQRGEGQQPGQGQQPGDPRQPQEPGQQNQRGSQPGTPQGQPRGERNQRGGENNNPFGGITGPYESNDQEQAGPLTGERFREWSDRLRDVEEMVGDPELRAEAARIRERARAVRAESKRHSAPPNWDLVRDQLLNPLTELEKRVAEEVLKRTTKKALVPLDRDPVPPEYAEKMRKYYERLGSGR